MGKPKATIRERTNNITELASFAGVARSTIYDWQKLPGYPIAKDGSVCKWDLCEWVLRRSMVTDDVEPEMSAASGRGDSPWLEKYREERAKLAALDRREREGQLVSRERMQSFMLRVAGLFRRWLDRLQRQMGNDFYLSGVNVLEDIRTEIHREFGITEQDDDGPELDQ